MRHHRPGRPCIWGHHRNDPTFTLKPTTPVKLYVDRDLTKWPGAVAHFARRLGR